jgi:large subunit ribosomal protein L24
MRIKKGDTVVVISGKDKGMTGEVLAASPKKHRVVVEGVNVQARHEKQTRQAPAEIRHVEGPIDVSNVMYYDKKTKEAVKIGYKIEDGKKIRVNKKTGEEID